MVERGERARRRGLNPTSLNPIMWGVEALRAEGYRVEVSQHLPKEPVVIMVFGKDGVRVKFQFDPDALTQK